MQPVWYARFPGTSPYDRFVKHSCVAVPTQHIISSASVIKAAQLVQLVCAYDYIKDGADLPMNPTTTFGSYLVRVLHDGRRMPVDMRRHTWPYASSSMLYDAHFNVIYLSCYNTTSYSGQKNVMKAVLSPSYNFASETSSTALSSSLGPALNATGYILPPPFAQGGPASTYPLGISFDSAVIEPLSGALLFYAFTVQGPNQFVNRWVFLCIP